jgi:hypothetical protein
MRVPLWLPLNPGRIFDAGFFSTQLLPDPLAGGVNLYFVPPPLSTDSNSPLFGFDQQNSSGSFTDVPATQDAGGLRKLGYPPGLASIAQ